MYLIKSETQVLNLGKIIPIEPIIIIVGGFTDNRILCDELYKKSFTYVIKFVVTTLAMSNNE